MDRGFSRHGVDCRPKGAQWLWLISPIIGRVSTSLGGLPYRCRGGCAPSRLCRARCGPQPSASSHGSRHRAAIVTIAVAAFIAFTGTPDVGGVSTVAKSPNWQALFQLGEE